MDAAKDEVKQSKKYKKAEQETIVSKYAPDNEFDNQVKKIVDKKYKKKYGKNAYERLKDQEENGATPKSKKDAEKMIKDAEKRVRNKYAKKAIDKEYGIGSYDNMMKQQGDGEGTAIDAYGKEKEKELKNQSPKRTLKAPKKQSTSTSSSNTNVTNQNDQSTTEEQSTTTKKKTIFGKRTQKGLRDPRTPQEKADLALLQDVTKITAAIALGGFAFGATDQLRTAISAGQFGYGLVGGILENSSKTATNDLVEMMRKYLNINGGNFDFSDITRILNDIKQNGVWGMHEKIDEEQRRISNELKSQINDSGDRKDLFNEIRSAVAKDGVDVDFETLLRKYCPNASETEKIDIESSLRGFASLLAEADIAKNIEKVETTGIPLSEMANICEKQLTKLDVDVEVNENDVNVRATTSNGSNTQRTSRRTNRNRQNNNGGNNSNPSTPNPPTPNPSTPNSNNT